MTIPFEYLGTILKHRINMHFKLLIIIESPELVYSNVTSPHRNAEKYSAESDRYPIFSDMKIADKSKPRYRDKTKEPFSLYAGFT